MTARWRSRCSEVSVPRPARVIALAVSMAMAVGAQLGADSAAPTVRITSPLGRTGGAGAIRIVAQVAPAHNPVQSVTFFVNSKAVGEDHEGPVYAVEWSD